MTADPDALRDRFAQVLSDHAIVPEQEGFHAWRCGHPDRYPGYCRCVPDLLDDLVAAAEARALPTVRALELDLSMAFGQHDSMGCCDPKTLEHVWSSVRTIFAAIPTPTPEADRE